MAPPWKGGDTSYDADGGLQAEEQAPRPIRPPPTGERASTPPHPGGGDDGRSSSGRRRHHYYINEDLAAVGPERRTWSMANYICLWVALSLNIPTYLLATSFIQGGMSYTAASLVVVVGSVAITPAIVANGVPGSRYGIPFPVLARASFGMKGANIAAMARALVACGWFGIQCWIGGQALYQLTLLCLPSRRLLLAPLPLQVIMFLLFWVLNLAVAFWGMEGLKHLLAVKGVVLSMVVLAMAVWALVVINDTSKRGGGGGHAVDYAAAPAHIRVSVDYYGAAITSVVGTWATLALNIPDFTRYAKSQRAQAWGQGLGLPIAMVGFALVCILVTAATEKLYGSPVYDPVLLVARLQGMPALQALGQLVIALATLATNLAANLVAPANDFSNLLPEYISFRGGAVITGVLSFATCPWSLLSSEHAFIYDWLVAYASLLGPLLGVLLCDYYLIRRQALDIHHLYSHEDDDHDDHDKQQQSPEKVGGKTSNSSSSNPYWYTGGYNLSAVGALLIGVAPNLPGFLVSVRAVKGGPGLGGRLLVAMYSYSWFIGLAVAALAYYALMTMTTTRGGRVRAGGGEEETAHDVGGEEEEEGGEHQDDVNNKTDNTAVASRGDDVVEVVVREEEHKYHGHHGGGGELLPG